MTEESSEFEEVEPTTEQQIRDMESRLVALRAVKEHEDKKESKTPPRPS